MLETHFIKKIHRGSNILDIIDTRLIAASMGMSVTGAGFQATVVAAPITMGLIIGTVLCGVLGTVYKIHKSKTLCQRK